MFILARMRVCQQGIKKGACLWTVQAFCCGVYVHICQQDCQRPLPETPAQTSPIIAVSHYVKMRCVACGPLGGGSFATDTHSQ